MATPRGKPASPVAAIYVLAGCNGAGKSTLGGEALRVAGVPHFNPDEAAREAMALRQRVGAGMSQQDANAWAWTEGVRLLQAAIAGRQLFALETTLGGRTIVEVLADAARGGMPVHVWFIGLDSVERHVARVAGRVQRGGHDIPRADIELRYLHSRANLIRLLPWLSSLRVYDNSVEASGVGGPGARPRLLLHWANGRVLAPRDLAATPGWAKPIVAAALRLAM